MVQTPQDERWCGRDLAPSGCPHAPQDTPPLPPCCPAPGQWEAFPLQFTQHPPGTGLRVSVLLGNFTKLPEAVGAAGWVFYASIT